MILGLGGGWGETAAATRATLILDAAEARPGTTVWAGVQLDMPPKWHTYWRNPGESGVATSVQWMLPAGLRAGELQWPVPDVLTSEGLTTYVYRGRVLLLAPLSVASNAPPGPVQVQAKIDWLECEEACVPGGARAAAALTVGAATVPSANAALVRSGRDRLPRKAEPPPGSSWWEPGPAPETKLLLVGGPASPGPAYDDFLPYASGDWEVSEPAGAKPPARAGEWRVTKVVKRLQAGFPAKLSGLLVQRERGGSPGAAVEVELAPQAREPERGPGAASAASSRLTLALLLKMLGLAFLGGLILNAMPCVLPVIALKILGFVQQSREAPGRVRRLGLWYALGVLGSFLVLAGMVIAVRAGGGAASWGMQMQNPYFRLALTVVVTLVALNLFGLFEVALGGGALSAAAGLASREGAAGAFFNGILATALATPCTAPFLTVAVGFAFTQSPAVVFGMFVSTALGLAAPYVLLSWRPGWLQFLPRPGPWMGRFKSAMGFPMLAAAIWLYSLTAPSFGEDGPLWLGLFLLVLALIAWVWGEFVQRGAARRALAAGVCLLLAAGAGGYLLEGQLHWRHLSPRAAGTAPAAHGGIAWQPWSPAAVEAARAGGRPVLVDFTAKWCLTCLSNKKVAIEIPSVRSRLEQIGAVAFRADHTDPDPAITAELKRYGRAGVPLVVVFPRRPGAEPIVLPALLTPGLVLDALAKAAE